MKKKIFFASDFHLGTDARLSSKEREKQIVAWLESIQDQADSIYLVGDIFDYWFEYGSVIPKGFSLFLGKLAELRNGGLPIYFFTGNHDMWMFDYFPDEYDIPIYRNPIQCELQGKKLFIGHGDGLGPGDTGYKVIKKVFSNALCQWCYARIHPNLGLRIMKSFSYKSRSMGSGDDVFFGVEKEMLIQYCERKKDEIDTDYFVFGHRHLPLDVLLSDNKTKYFGLGDWIDYQSYGVLDNGAFSLQYFNRPDKTKKI